MEYYAGGTSVRSMAANGTVTEIIDTHADWGTAERLARAIARALAGAYQAGQDGK
jgi:hypothetical protein